MDIEQQLTRLRDLRRRSTKLGETASDDLKLFLAPDQLTFRWLLKKHSGNVAVASTCTCLLTAVASSQLAKVYTRRGDRPFQADALGKERALEALDLVFKEPWDSSGLPDGNPFTVTIVARAAGALARAGIGNENDFKSRVHAFAIGNATGLSKVRKESLERIVVRLAERIPDSIRVRQYPPHPTIGYWLVEAIDGLHVTLQTQQWVRLANWAAGSFAFELSRVVSGHDALMDPIALAMAACLCRNVQRIASGESFRDAEVVLRELPTLQELEFGVTKFVALQRDSGIWSKFFPLFQYRNAANYCFSFEVLEAIITQFDSAPLNVGNRDDFRVKPTIFERDDILTAFEKAVDWCEHNKLQFSADAHQFRGWSSGGDRESLRDGRPEVWATGTVHMFAAKLQRVLQHRIQELLILKYDATRPSGDLSWRRFIDAQVNLPEEGGIVGVKAIIEREIAEPYRQDGKLKRRTVLLFGPPGTSKTMLVRGFASHFGWQCVEITPSNFLRRGLEQIYVSAEEVFKDLNDLRRVVVFFDEMDALVQRRDDDGAERLDVTQQFLTTSMLPHLAKLHESGEIIFFMATNHQGRFDQAIKRPGRFDLLLCIPPPTWAAKKHSIERFSPDDDASDLDDARALLDDWVPDTSSRAEKLDVFTFDELKSLFETVRRQVKREKGPLSGALGALGEAGFIKLADEWYANHITLRPFERPNNANSLLAEFKEDQLESKLQ